MDRRSLMAAGLGVSTAGFLPADGVEAAAERARRRGDPLTSFDPWVEVSRSRVEGNARAITAAAKGARLMPVIKANGYGLDAATVARIYDPMPEVWGFMVARPHEAAELAQLKLRKPVLLMAPASDADTVALAELGLHLSMTLKDTPQSVTELSRRAKRPLRVHVELDTGINRQGIPWRNAADRIVDLHRSGAVRIHGIASYFITPPEDVPQTAPWAPELDQIERYEQVLGQVKAAGAPVGLCHMTSSRSFFQYPQAYYDAVRMGVLPTGSFPTPEARATRKIRLEQSYEIKCRVAQVSLVPAGDFVGFGRKHAITRDTYVATVLSGSPGGLPKDRRVWVNGQLRPLLMTGPRLYTLVDLGPEPIAKVGDIVVMTGRQDPSITAEGLGNSWYGYSLADRLPPVVVL